jgi:signal transduction histidine kinase
VALRSTYVAEGGGVRTMSSRSDMFLLRSDGIEIPIEVALSSMSFEDQGLVVATVRDASARRKTELGAERERAFLRAMNEVSSALHDAGDIDAMLRLVTRHSRRLLDADFAMLILPCADDHETLVVRATDGDRARALLGSRHPPDHSTIGWSTRNHDIALIADGTNDPRLFRPANWPPDVGATLIVPLLARDGVIGSLTIAKRSGRPMFDAADIPFVETFAAHATLAITYARTHEVIEGARRLQVAAAQSEAQLQLQREIVERLEDLGREKTEFVSRVSHELRSPLASIIGFVELLIDGDPGETTEEQNLMLAIVERNSRRLLNLIEDLLLISRVESGGFELELGRVDLAEVIANVLEISRLALAKADVELAVDLGPDAWLIADQAQLERALLNLVSNAMKFNRPHGKVSIESRTDGADIAISVCDTGTGIPAEEQERLFTRFFRAARARTEEIPGSGLGLSIVKEIVDRHDGTVRVRSTPSGSTFTLRLPINGPPPDRTRTPTPDSE